jgi:hypothetical protein
VSKKKVTKKVTKKTTRVATPMAPRKNNPPVEQMKPVQAPKEKMAVLSGNCSRATELNSKVSLVMAFKPQITFDNDRAIVLIGSDLENGIYTHESTVLGAMLLMADKLINRHA